MGKVYDLTPGGLPFDTFEDPFFLIQNNQAQTLTKYDANGKTLGETGALAARGELYQTDFKGNIYYATGTTLRKVSKEGELSWTTTLPGSATSSGRMVLNESANHLIISYTSGGGMNVKRYSMLDGSEIAGTTLSTGSASSHDLIHGSNDRLFLASFQSGSPNRWDMKRHTAFNGTADWTFSIDDTVYSLGSVRILAINSSDEVYIVADRIGFTSIDIIKVDATGSQAWAYNITPTGSATRRITIDETVCMDDDSVIIYTENGFADTPNGLDARIEKVSAAGAQVWTYDVPYQIRGTRSITRDNDNNIYYANDAGSNRMTIRKLSDAGAFLEDVVQLNTVGDFNRLSFYETNPVAFEVDDMGLSTDIYEYQDDVASANVVDISLMPDGLRLYMLGQSGSGVSQFVLGEPNRPLFSTFQANTLDVSGEDPSEKGLYVKADGTKLYYLGNTNDRVYQYTMSTPHDLGTATYDSVSFSFASETTSPSDGALQFSSDGTRMYVCSSLEVIYQYNLTTPWDLSTASYSGKSFNISTFIGSITGFTLSGDGSKLYASDQLTVDQIKEFEFGTNFELDTLTDTGRLCNTATGFNCAGIDISGDGRTIIINEIQQPAFRYVYN